MTFAQQLNDYIHTLGCSAMELAEHSGVSAAAISRYRSGAREPERESEIVSRLAAGLHMLAVQRGKILSAEEAASVLNLTLPEGRQQYPQLSEHFDQLAAVLQISLNDLAKSLNFDASYLSRIRAGRRTPANGEQFVDGVCRYVVRRYSTPEDMAAVAELLRCTTVELNLDNYYQKLNDWFTQRRDRPPVQLSRFLRSLDEFDLEEYVRDIHFRDTEADEEAYCPPADMEEYDGLERLRQGELNFLRATYNAPSMEPVYLYNDMPERELMADRGYARTYMLLLAQCLKRGLHLNVIHSLYRPVEEIIRSFENWIPVYMTGYVSPYHLRRPVNEVFQHKLFVSGSAALVGEAINGYPEEGRCVLFTQPEEVDYFRRRAERLLSKAVPLLEVFRESDQRKLDSFYSTAAWEPGVRRHICAAPPIYTISRELMEEMLLQTQMPQEERERLLDWVAERRRGIEQLLKEYPVRCEVPELSREELERYPMCLPLAHMFSSREVRYDYEQYRRHMEQTEAFAQSHPHFSLTKNPDPAFRNIQLEILENQWVLISRCCHPQIHFLARHPRMVSALQEMRSI